MISVKRDENTSDREEGGNAGGPASSGSMRERSENMKEKTKSVERLLSAIYRNADERSIQILAYYLHYDARQLEADISEIPNVVVKEKK